MISSKLELNADYKLKYMLSFFQCVYKYYFGLTRMSVQEILKIKEWEKRDIYFIHNKVDVQNGVYYNYGNSFLVSKELYFMTV